MDLYKLVVAMKLTKGGGGSDVSVDPLSVTENGTYTAEDGHAYSPVTVNVSGGGAILKPIVLRPDAELIAKYTSDRLIVEDDGATIPAYSTSNKVLKASSELGRINSPDFATYDYFYVYRGLVYPIYSSDTKYAGKQEYVTISYCGEIDYMAGGVVPSLDGTKRFGSSRYAVRAVSNSYDVYWSSATAIELLDSASYGATLSTTVVSTNGANIVISEPNHNLRGHNTYLKQTAWEEITDIRYQYVIELYRSKKGDLNCDGWCIHPCALHSLECISSADHILT